MDIDGTDSSILTFNKQLCLFNNKEESLTDLQFPKLYETIWEHSNTAMRLTDEEGIIISVNNLYCQLIGLNKKEIIGKYYFEVYDSKHIEHSTFSLSKYKEFFLQDKFSNYRQYRSSFINGKVLDLDVQYQLIKIDDDKVLLLSLFQDITEKLKKEEKVKHSEKLATIGKMAAYLSHEIKTPLISINMNLDIIQKNLELPDSKKRSLTIIQTEVKRLNNMLKEVLQFSKEVEPVFMSISLDKLIYTIKELMQPLLDEKNILLVNNLESIKVMGDYQKLYNVFIHLFENSVEAIESHGVIEIKSTEITKTNEICITITDSGCGIKDPKNIFEPFFTTKKGGTGLGLAIVKKIVEEMYGKIELHSSKLGKTVFMIKLKKWD